MINDCSNDDTTPVKTNDAHLVALGRLLCNRLKENFSDLELDNERKMVQNERNQKTQKMRERRYFVMLR